MGYCEIHVVIPNGDVVGHTECRRMGGQVSERIKSIIGRIWRWLFPTSRSVRAISVSSAPRNSRDRYHVVIDWSDGSQWQARGSIAIWHKYPTGEALGNSLTLKIIDAVKAYEWSRE